VYECVYVCYSVCLHVIVYVYMIERVYVQVSSCKTILQLCLDKVTQVQILTVPTSEGWY